MSGDSEDLEALFDQVASERAATIAEPSPPVSPAREIVHRPEPSTHEEEVFDRVGRLTRNLHTALQELGYDKTMEKVVDASADTRTRLSYIADLTGKAADKVLESVDAAKPLAQALGEGAATLSGKWDEVFAGSLGGENFRGLALETHAYLKAAPANARATEEHLLNIMMAQDFHDLTGQVIKRLVKLAQELESELVEFLIEADPREALSSDAHSLSGPVVQTDGRTDIVTNQAQVDDLLAQLGF